MRYALQENKAIEAREEENRQRKGNNVPEMGYRGAINVPLRPRKPLHISC